MPKKTTWTTCRCTYGHSNILSFVKCKFHRVYSSNITGTGNWAAVTECRPTKITLLETEAQAIEQVERFNWTRCGAGCQGFQRHYLAEIRMPQPENKERIKPA